MPVALLVDVGAGEGALGAGLAGHLVLLRGQLLAPLLLGLLDLRRHLFSFRLCVQSTPSSLRACDATAPTLRRCARLAIARAVARRRWLGASPAAPRSRRRPGQPDRAALAPAPTRPTRRTGRRAGAGDALHDQLRPRAPAASRPCGAGRRSTAPPATSRPTSSAATNSATKPAAATSPTGSSASATSARLLARRREHRLGDRHARHGALDLQRLDRLAGPPRQHPRPASPTSASASGSARLEGTAAPTSGPRTSAARTAADRGPPRPGLGWRRARRLLRARRRALRATELTRGPWDPGAQHAGPPAALLGRALERLPDAEEFQVGRVTFEILRSVPIGAGRGRGPGRAARAAGCRWSRPS